MLGRPYAYPEEKRDPAKDIEPNEAGSSNCLDLNTPNREAEINKHASETCTGLSRGRCLHAAARCGRAPRFRAERQGLARSRRGSIASFGGESLTVNTREGQTVNIALTQGWMVSSVASAAVSDIRPSHYIGIASLPTKDGGDGALEVLIFPPALTGAGEGSFG